MLNLTISTLVFFIAAWFLNRYLDEQGIPKGLTRGVVVLVLASLMSWVVGWAADWAQVKVEGPQATLQTAGAVAQILKDANQVQP
jgi:UDP-N-acetylmuramyl pentapeptide phosphotransferase/UDP-N-acetylglucosamine-1-phosphate transferase